MDRLHDHRPPEDVGVHAVDELHERRAGVRLPPWVTALLARLEPGERARRGDPRRERLAGGVDGTPRQERDEHGVVPRLHEAEVRRGLDQATDVRAHRLDAVRPGEEQADDRSRVGGRQDALGRAGLEVDREVRVEGAERRPPLAPETGHVVASAASRPASTRTIAEASRGMAFRLFPPFTAAIASRAARRAVKHLGEDLSELPRPAAMSIPEWPPLSPEILRRSGTVPAAGATKLDLARGDGVDAAGAADGELPLLLAVEVQEVARAEPARAIPFAPVSPVSSSTVTRTSSGPWRTSSLASAASPAATPMPLSAPSVVPPRAPRRRRGTRRSGPS